MARRIDRGVQSALLAAVLFGASTPLAKGLLASVPPQVLAGLLYLGSGLGLGVVWLWQRRTVKVGEAALTRRDLPWLPRCSRGGTLRRRGGGGLRLGGLAARARMVHPGGAGGDPRPTSSALPQRGSP